MQILLLIPTGTSYTCHHIPGSPRMHDNNNKNNSDDTSSPSSTRSSTPEGTVTGTPRVQLFSAGRRPWFDLELPRPPHATRSKVSDANAPALHSRAGQVTAANSGGSPVKASTAFVIGVTGGSASGKTSVAELVIRSLDVPVWKKECVSACDWYS